MKKNGPEFIEECPNCESRVRAKWTSGRMLRLECGNENCDWHGAPYVPPKKVIKTTKTKYLDGGGWHYEMFDSRGHVAVSSQSYSSESACEKAARADIARTSKSAAYGRCRAVIWPPHVVVKGRLIG